MNVDGVHGRSLRDCVHTSITEMATPTTLPDDRHMTRNRAEWMTPEDDRILELMGSDEVFSPDHVAAKDVCSGPDAAYRCRELAKAGLLEQPITGVYDLTALGRQYLAGEVDASELERADD